MNVEILHTESTRGSQGLVHISSEARQNTFTYLQTTLYFLYKRLKKKVLFNVNLFFLFTNESSIGHMYTPLYCK